MRVCTALAPVCICPGSPPGLLPLATAGACRACCHRGLAVVPYLGRWGLNRSSIDGDLIAIRQAVVGFAMPTTAISPANMAALIYTCRAAAVCEAMQRDITRYTYLSRINSSIFNRMRVCSPNWTLPYSCAIN